MRDIKGEKNPRWNGGIAEYPDHAEFKRNRLVVLKQSKGLCMICGERAQVVHHIDGSRDNHKIENLMALCDSCHWASHAKEAEFVNGVPMSNRPSSTSKYRRLYGYTLDEMSAILGWSTSTTLKLLRDPKQAEVVLKQVKDITAGNNAEAVAEKLERLGRGKK